MSPIVFEPAPVPPPDEEHVVRAVPIDQIDDSPLRARKATADVDAMAETIKLRGILQPGIVRPARGRFELVLGQTRLEAARLVGLKAFPSFVRDLSDSDARAFYVIENLHRREMHPLDEADAYRKLRDEHGWSTDRIAKEIGSTPSTVRARLKLNELAESLILPYLDGKLAGVVALSIARIPGADQQEMAARQILRPGNPEGALSTAAALEHIKRNYMLTEGGAAMRPSDLFTCGPLACRLSAAGCVTRQDARKQTGAHGS
jgi:ParB/RepB/Spo0J family partition protein